LWPYPKAALDRAATGCRRVAVLEQNAGQMVTDVLLSILGRVEVTSIGGISTDHSGFGVGALLNADEVRRRIDAALPPARVA
jgi:hypothetical protein